MKDRPVRYLLDVILLRYPFKTEKDKDLRERREGTESLSFMTKSRFRILMVRIDPHRGKKQDLYLYFLYIFCRARV